MIKKFSSLLFTATLLFSIHAVAQRPRTIEADGAFAKGDYYDAIDLYKKAYSKESDKEARAEIIFKTAECYRLVNDAKNQEVWYDKAIKAEYKDNIAILRLADALKFQGKYDEAMAKYNEYSKAEPSDDKGTKGAAACEQAQKWKDKPTRHRLDNVSPINTRYADFGEVYATRDRRTLIFCSSRQEATGKINDGGTGEKFQDLFEAQIDKKGKWSTPTAMPLPINGEANEGAATLDRKANEMYFTRCSFDKNHLNLCGIFYTKRKGQTWEEPIAIKLGPDSFTYGHPSLAPDGQTLYFSSDMPGTLGGKDIWMVKYDKKRRDWGEAENLGPVINTELDDMFPYVAEDGALYFSSKGHTSMGGMDIFKSRNDGNKWDEPVNMRYPLNTSADDFAFIINETNDKGYLSSNREGGKGGDDIWMWTLPPLVFTVSGKVYDEDTKALLEGADIVLTGVSDGTTVPFKTDKTGTYKFDLKPETDYKVSASRKDYLNKYVELSTKGLEQSKDFIGDFDFALKSIIKPIVLPNILYDLDKYDLRAESKVSLDSLVMTLNENPTVVIELGSHTDTRADDQYNVVLSNNRAKSVVDYLISKGIDKERLEYKGYGETVPRVLSKDMGNLKKGDVITDAFIAKLKGKDLQEEAHQLNRRTEFKVLRTDYVKPGTEGAPPKEPERFGGEENNELKKEDMGVQMVPHDSAAAIDNAAPKDEAQAGGTEAASGSEPGKIHTVEKGETYQKIAKMYGITIIELKKLNELKNEPIYEGMELKVDKNGNYSAYDEKFYVLTKDDKSWNSVAKKLGMKSGDLKKMNPKIDDSNFRAGLKIRKEN
jgi:peptidoglycan-associated lipoprotein